MTEEGYPIYLRAKPFSAVLVSLQSVDCQKKKEKKKRKKHAYKHQQLQQGIGSQGVMFEIDFFFF